MISDTTDIKKPSFEYYWINYQNWIEDNLWLILLISALWFLTGTIWGGCVVALLTVPVVIKKIKIKKNVSR